MTSHSHLLVDSHHHLWKLTRGDYGWLDKSLGVLYQDYLVDDFKAETGNQNIAKSLLVQAADTDAETDFLLSVANQNDLIAGVVGWIDWEADSEIVCQRLVNLASEKKFKGVRPMLQDIEDIDWILNPDFDVIFRQLIKLDLSFDALVKTEHLPNLLILAKRYPSLKFVIDHCAKPSIANDEWSEWAAAIRHFKDVNNVFVKVSGLVTEARPEQVSQQDYHTYFKHIQHTFGAYRMMWGSDWPVLKLNSTYDLWVKLSEQLVENWTQQDKRRFWSGTACEFYRLSLEDL